MCPRLSLVLHGKTWLRALLVRYPARAPHHHQLVAPLQGKERLLQDLDGGQPQHVGNEDLEGVGGPEHIVSGKGPPLEQHRHRGQGQDREVGRGWQQQRLAIGK